MQRCALHRVSDPQERILSQIAELLPVVNNEEVYMEPGLVQLAAMAREDPESLQRVANFKVGHKRFGSVTWREPVDVRCLDLDTALVFMQGSVEVTPPPPPHPPTPPHLAPASMDTVIICTPPSCISAGPREPISGRQAPQWGGLYLQSSQSCGKYLLLPPPPTNHHHIHDFSAQLSKPPQVIQKDAKASARPPGRQAPHRGGFDLHVFQAPRVSSSFS